MRAAAPGAAELRSIIDVRKPPPPEDYMSIIPLPSRS